MREMVEAGAIGRLTTFRAREGHSGPHAAHFWDAELAGGGALLDMASHGAEARATCSARTPVVRDVFAWGATLVHGEQDHRRGQRGHVIRFADGRAATMDVSWSSKGGLEGRFEVYGDAGRIIQDMASTPLRAFIERPAGYLGEKTDADTGWVFPVPNETYVHGHDAMMRHMVEAFRAGATPRETFHDGLAVNAILDAAYRSMQSGRWEPVAAPRPAAVHRRDDDATRRPPPATGSRADPRRARALAATQADAIERGQPVVRRGDRRRRPRPSVRDRPLADPGRGDVPPLRLVPRVQPDRRAVDDVPHPGRRGQRPAPGDVHRADARPGRGHPVELHTSGRTT